MVYLKSRRCVFIINVIFECPRRSQTFRKDGQVSVVCVLMEQSFDFHETWTLFEEWSSKEVVVHGSRYFISAASSRMKEDRVDVRRS